MKFSSILLARKRQASLSKTRTRQDRYMGQKVREMEAGKENGHDETRIMSTK
jgi:hypothetical protein